MDINIEFARKTSLAYNRTCKSLCQELKLPQTARDIVEIRKLKANLVSVNVDKLVCDGYLERHAIESDRRKTELLCTEKAQPIIAKGRQLQQDFIDRILTGLDNETRQKFLEILNIMDQNLDNILKGEA